MTLRDELLARIDDEEKHRKAKMKTDIFQTHLLRREWE